MNTPGGSRSATAAATGLSWPVATLLLAAAFAIRLAFGLVSEFWGEDQLQIYLIGLKFFTTGAWPYFGPDVVYTQTRIPGALQGLLVGGPFWIVAAPEAPYVLLNALSFAALTMLGWYASRRVPDLSRWFLWGWIFFSPWTLDFSTHMVNPSYTIVGAVPFFIGTYELVPALRVGVLSRAVAGLCVGAGLLWVYQLHLSVSLLAPIALVALAAATWEDRAAGRRAVLGFTLGAAVAAATLVPTLVHVGLRSVAGNASANVTFVPANLWRLPQIVAQYLSFASYEVPRFIGPDTSLRLAFLERYWWAAPFIVFAGLCGLAQTAFLVLSLAGSRRENGSARAARRAAIALLAFVYVSFLFSVRAPASHAFYVTLPVIVIHSFHYWERWWHLRALRVVTALLLIAGAVTQLAIAVDNFTERSLYTNRATVVRAIREKNYHLVGERRSDGWPDAH